MIRDKARYDAKGIKQHKLNEDYTLNIILQECAIHPLMKDGQEAPHQISQFQKLVELEARVQGITWDYYLQEKLKKHRGDISVELWTFSDGKKLYNNWLL